MHSFAQSLSQQKYSSLAAGVDNDLRSHLASIELCLFHNSIYEKTLSSCSKPLNKQHIIDILCDESRLLNERDIFQ